MCSCGECAVVAPFSQWEVPEIEWWEYAVMTVLSTIKDSIRLDEE